MEGILNSWQGYWKKENTPRTIQNWEGKDRSNELEIGMYEKI